MSLSFQSTRPVWGATTFDVVLASHILFQSTRPVWGATWRLEAVLAICLFQSTRPVWGATKTSGFITLYCIFQSTRPVWGATCKGGSQPKDSVYFNPRAPCGARRPPFCLYPYYKNFNPRAPCGARHLTLWRPSYITLFQSTRPVWGATVTCCANHPIITLFQSTRPVWGATLKRRLLDGRTFISIHAPRVGRDPEAAAAHKDEQISIHAPRVGRDSHCAADGAGNGISIHAPRVGRDHARPHQSPVRHISIHAPRVGRDRLSPSAPGGHRYFNPRAPCGARPSRTPPVISCRIFQSTRPVWGATSRSAISKCFDRISIHAPRVGRDQKRCPGVLPRHISIHAPRVGRDSKFDDFTPSNLHKRYKRVLARPKNTREKGKIKQKLAYIHAFSAFLGCEGSGTFCALVLRTQYR